MLLCNMYRPPRDRNRQLKAFLEEITPVIEKISRFYQDVLFVGDINIDLLKINNRDLYGQYLDLFLTSGFLPQINLPTRLTKRKGTIIDHTLTKLSKNSKHVKSAIVVSRISDHLPTISAIRYDIAQQCPPKYIMIQQNSKKAINKFCDEISKADIIGKLDSNPVTNPNENYDKIENILTDANNKHLPMTKVKFRRYKHKLNCWITVGILRSIKFRDTLYKKLKTTDCELPLYETLKHNLKTYNKILKKNIRLAKQKYYKSLFEKYKNNCKKTWDTVKTLLNSKQKTSDFPSKFIVNGNEINDEQQILESFNTFLQRLGQDWHLKYRQMVWSHSKLI